MEGYVYSLWSGRLLVKKATINEYPADSRNVGLSYARFTDGSYVVVNKDPAKMYNAMVWMEDRSDEIAIGLLIEHEMVQIEKLQEKIGNHNHKIKILNATLSGAL